MRHPLARSALLLAVLTGATPPLAAQSIRINANTGELEARARQDSLDPSAHYNLALGYMARRQWARADTALTRATALDPKFAVAWLARAMVWERDERYWRELRRTSRETERAERDRRDTFYRRAFLVDPFVDLRILGGFTRITGYLSYYAWRFGGDFRAFEEAVNRGMQGLVEGDYNRAVEGFEYATAAWNRLSRRDTLPEWILFHRALARTHAGRLADAQQDFAGLLGRTERQEDDDTTRFTPLRTNEFRYMLAALKHRAGDSTGALALYHEVREQDLGNYMASVQIARLNEAAGRWSDGIAARRAAATTNPEDHTLLVDLAESLIRTNRLPDAESALVQALELNPSDPRVHYRLGIVRMARQDRAGARAAFERFLAIAPSRYANAANDARTRLGQLQ